MLIPDIVLAETVGTLKGKCYRASRADIVAAVTALLEEPNVVFESRDAVWAALRNSAAAGRAKADASGGGVDFADALSVHKSMLTARLWDQPYLATYTFDQAALALPGTRHP